MFFNILYFRFLYLVHAPLVMHGNIINQVLTADLSVTKLFMRFCIVSGFEIDLYSTFMPECLLCGLVVNCQLETGVDMITDS